MFKLLILIIIKFYRYFISPFLSVNCRFHPTCSSYAINALKKHDILYALLLIGKRIMKCNPFFKGGYDPIL